MVPQAAEIVTEQVVGDDRTAVRRTLRLGVRAYSSGDVAMALILNISETGIMIETVVELAVGETIEVDIPEASTSMARVVWTQDLLAGCEFASPVSTAIVSAAQLRSPTDAVDPLQEERAAHGFRSGNDAGQPEEAAISMVIIVTYIVAGLALLILVAAILPRQ